MNNSTNATNIGIIDEALPKAEPSQYKAEINTQNTLPANNEIYDSKDFEKAALGVSYKTLIVNSALTVIKLIAGIVAHSGAMISDSVHTASDVLSTLVVIVSVKVAAKQSDHDHPYGHERFESLGSILLSGMLFITGIWIGYSSLSKAFLDPQAKLVVPGTLALVAAILSIAVKEWMFWYTKFVADRTHSTALTADAWHHRSDALSSVGALIGIAGARLGFPVLDPVASLVIALMIIKTSWDIARNAANQLTDTSCDEAITIKMQSIIVEQRGVIAVRDLKTRLFGTRMYVDATIICSGHISLYDAHAIAELVHKSIESNFPAVKHCNVHVDPDNCPNH